MEHTTTAAEICPNCLEPAFEVTDRGLAGITPIGKCRACGHEVTTDDADWADMRAQIDDPTT